MGPRAISDDALADESIYVPMALRWSTHESIGGWIGASTRAVSHPARPARSRVGRCHCLGGCDQPAAGCEPHHVLHRQDGGHTSLTNLKDYCWWHHHVVLHQMGWKLTVHPDGTSQVQSPGGKTIHSHSPPPRPG